jgi:cytochrome P450
MCSVDTTTASLLAIILAMVAFPEAQARLRAAVDAVVPRDRMPTSEDMPELQYAMAFALEALRWRSSNRYVGFSPRRPS